MDKLIYLIGGVAFLVPVVVIMYCRKDLRYLATIAGICGGVAALVTEPIFTRDYWLPPNLLGWEHICVEDFFFGAGITALIAILYPAVKRLRFSDKGTRKMRYGVYAFFSVAAILSMYVFHFVLGVNSVLVSAGLCVVYAPVMWILRRDLIRPSLVVASIIIGSVLLLYLLFFDIIAPEWWDKYWLLKGTWLGVTVLGNVPLTELLWYGGWAVFASIIWPFSEGRVFEPMEKQ